MADPLLIAKNGEIECHLLPGLANRHGLITGATGTGKTITLQTLAEGLSKIGVPVFMADVKGDLTGISQAGRLPDKVAKTLAERGLPAPAPLACPATLWDVFGEQGHPVRATVSDMGPLLLGRMLALNEIQQGVLSLVFKIADDNGLLLLDLKDLRAMLQHVGEHAKEFTTEYGNISAASVGAIQRGLLQIEEQGGDRFFGEPMLDIADFMQTGDVACGSCPPRGRRDVWGRPVVVARQGRYQHPRRRQADERTEALRDLPAVDALRAVRDAARGGRSRSPQAGVLLRRGPPAVQRRAQGPGRAHRAGGAAGALQGRGRVLRDAEPARRARQRAGAARQPRAACPARLHAARPEGGQERPPAPCAPTARSTWSPRSPSWPSARPW